jgi:C1q domain
MPATIFSGSDVKTLKDNLSLNDKAKILPVSGSPASGAGLAAPIGSLALDYTNGKTYKKIGALDTDWSELGSGIGGINYVTNTDAEAGTTGWSTYADAAGAQPVDGTGGSPNVTWTRSTTTPLRGTADFNFAKDAANRQGQGVATDITINLADQAKVLTVSFDYEILSGTYATGDLTVYLIQDPAGTPVVIQPAGYQVQAATVGTKMRQIATFQTASTGQSYRICFHVASTSATAYTLAIDNVICGPQVVQYGAPVTDWQSYTPTFTGFGTVSTQAFWYRRVGDSVEIKGRFTSGTSTATEARITLPSGLSSDSNKINSVLELAGKLNYNLSAATYFSGGTVLIEPSVAYMTFGLEASTRDGLTKVNGNAIVSSGQSVSLIARVAISGWSSTVQMSNDTDTRVVAARASGDPASATSGNPIIFPTTAFDTHGAYNSSTGRYTVSVPGFYRISGAIVPGTGGAVGLFAYVNAVSVARAGNTDSNTAGVFTALVQVNAGDLIDIRPNATLDAGSGSVINFERLSGPSAIAASETVSVVRVDTSGSSVGTTDSPDSARSLIAFAGAEIDTHGAFSAGVFTAPISGKYLVSTNVGTQSTTGTNLAIHIYKNGASVARGYVYNPSAGTVNMYVSLAKELNLLAGETVEIRGRASTSMSLDNTLNMCRLSIVRVGN